MANRHYPEEFKRDVVALARKGEVPKKQIAADVGILRDHPVPVDQPLRQRP